MPFTHPFLYLKVPNDRKASKLDRPNARDDILESALIPKDVRKIISHTAQ